MKKIFGIAVLALATLVFTSCGGGKNKITDPMEYNNQLMTVINSLNSDAMSLGNAMRSGDYVKTEEVRKSWEAKIDSSITVVKALGDFKGDASFQEVVVTALTSYKTLVGTDYKQLIELEASLKEGEEPSEEFSQKEAALLSKIDATSNSLMNQVNEAGSKFEQSLK